MTAPTRGHDIKRYVLSVGPEHMEHDYCSDCGSSAGWEECTNCDDGMSHHDCGEDCCACALPEDNVPCDICEGKGGWWVCLGGHTLTLPSRDEMRRMVAEEKG